MSFELLDISFKKGSGIAVPATLRPYANKGFSREVKLILDTGASSAHISTEILNQMGYNDTMFTKDKNVSFAVIGKYHATLCKVEGLDFCGIKFNNHTVKVWNPPKDHHADGIIGMSLLKYFNISINVDTQRAVIKQSQATIAMLHKNKP